MTIETGAELEALEAGLQRCDESCNAANATNEGVSSWSTHQHLYHLALATDLSLTNVASLVRGEGMLVVQGGATDPLAEEVLSKSTFPRGEAEAPRMVRPGSEVDGQLLEQEWSRNRETLSTLKGQVPAIEAAAEHIPHQTLGLMSAAQWLRFARLHLEHHLAIIDDISAAAG